MYTKAMVYKLFTVSLACLHIYHGLWQPLRSVRLINSAAKAQPFTRVTKINENWKTKEWALLKKYVCQEGGRQAHVVTSRKCTALMNSDEASVNTSNG